MLGYHPQVILAGRRINDGMGKFVAEQTVKHLIQGGAPVKGADVVVLGLTFKENCPDLRNSRVIDVVRELQSYGATVHVHDPVAQPEEAMHEYGVRLVPWDGLPRAAAMVAAVAHREFKARPIDDYVAKLGSGRAVRRREMPDGSRRASRAGDSRVAALMTLHATIAGLAPPLARDRQRRVHRLPPRRDAARARAGGREHRQLRDRLPGEPRGGPPRGRRGRLGAAPLHRGRHRRSRDLSAGVPGRGRCPAPGGAGLGAALDRGSAAHARRERDRFPQRADRGARCRRPPVRLRRVELDLRRRAEPAEGRGSRSGGRSRRTR